MKSYLSQMGISLQTSLTINMLQQPLKIAMSLLLALPMTALAQSVESPPNSPPVINRLVFQKNSKLLSVKANSQFNKHRSQCGPGSGSQSHCREIPEEQRQLEPWLDTIREKIKDCEHFEELKQLVVSNFFNRDLLVCDIALDEHGQRIKNLRLSQCAYKTGGTSVSADSLFRDPTNKLILGLLPFEPPPNDYPSKYGIVIVFERKYPDALISVYPGIRKRGP